jgi:pantetheine-phosphate adenylyltransferase
MRRVVVPGSFDPVTNGHLDIVTRASAMFDEVVVAVGTNTAKGGLVPVAERLDLLREVCAELPNVAVASFAGLLVDFCRERQAGAVVRGVRSGVDIDDELQMARMNSALMPGLETILLPSSPAYSFVASSLVREVVAMGGDVSTWVPAAVLLRLRADS